LTPLKRLGEVRGGPWKSRAYLRKKYPGILPLSEAQIEVFEFLAKMAPTNAYKIAKESGKAYSFVYNSLKILEMKKMAVDKGKKKTEKGTMANIYDLTLEGVLLILHLQLSRPYYEETKTNYNFIRRLLENYQSLLPLVFGKWEHFEKMKVTKIAFHRLEMLVNTYAHDPGSFTPGSGFPRGMETEQKICWFFYFQGHMFNYSEVWVATLKQDEEIKKYVINAMKAYQKRLENTRSLIKKTVSLLETP